MTGYPIEPQRHLSPFLIVLFTFALMTGIPILEKKKRKCLRCVQAHSLVLLYCRVYVFFHFPNTVDVQKLSHLMCCVLSIDLMF